MIAMHRVRVFDIMLHSCVSYRYPIRFPRMVDAHKNAIHLKNQNIFLIVVVFLDDSKQRESGLISKRAIEEKKTAETMTRFYYYIYCAFGVGSFDNFLRLCERAFTYV